MLLLIGALLAVSISTGGLGGVFTSRDALLADPRADGPATGGPPTGGPVPAAPAPPTSAVPAAPTSPPAAASRAPERAARAASRATRSAQPRPAPSRSTRPAGVVGSGSCGVSYYETGEVTANGEPYDPEGFTAAHKTLPFNTRVRVTNPDNGESVVVRINDRGPFIEGRCIDLSRAAFRGIAPLSAGVITGRYEILAG